MSDAARMAEAFNRGCDVRLAGRPRWHCPYPAEEEQSPRRAFMKGYDDVSEFWGLEAGWPVKPLPPVQGDKTHVGDCRVPLLQGDDLLAQAPLDGQARPD